MVFPIKEVSMEDFNAFLLKREKPIFLIEHAPSMQVIYLSI
jgi:hypothetical protein